MNSKKSGQIVLPALRGVMGDWVYYSCLMDLQELGERVGYAAEIHKNHRLSDMIQRQLKISRSVQIAEYLKTQPERFFNSLVVGTYEGRPNWHALSEVRSKGTDDELADLNDETVESVGFLTLRGDEKLFALDGQHRLAGIKKAIEDGIEQDPYDEVPVIFVGHRTSKEGLERTRRLFTTLNKTARPVSKGDIIALDEDDVMAISVRWLIEGTELFPGNKVAFVASNNLSARNTSSLTTIGNLYDVLTILFTDSQWNLKKRRAELRRVRPNEEELSKYFAYSRRFFDELRMHFEELEEFFGSKNSDAVVKKFRGSHGGNALFRPIGLGIFARIIARYTKDLPLDQAVKLAAELPRELNKPPYAGLMWDISNMTILNSHIVTLREILLFMVGKSKFTEGALTERYRRATGDDKSELPDKVV